MSPLTRTVIRAVVRPQPARAGAVLAFVLALAACRPAPPPTDQPPEPQAQAHTELRDAIQSSQEQAKATADALQQGADAQRAQIEAAEGG